MERLRRGEEGDPSRVRGGARGLPPRWLPVIALATMLLSAGLGCKRSDEREHGRKILHAALRTKLGSLDPVRCRSQTENIVVSAIFEPLFQYRPGVRPYVLEPNLLAAMPDVSADGLTYTFTLKSGVFFQDDPAFADGVGREATAEDVIYSIKRMADRRFLPSGFGLYAGRILGFDAYKEAQARRAPEAFDYDVPVEGLELLDRRRFRIRLVRPFPQLMNILGTCYASVVAREVVERYGEDVGAHPVGTGPFRLASLLPESRVVLARHPRHRAEPRPAPTGALERDAAAPASVAVPALDGLVFHVFEEDQPMWLAWRVGDIDYIPVPADDLDALLDDNKTLRPQFAAEGVRYAALPKLDFMYRGFNMEDPIVGGNGPGKKIRQAISLLVDTEELSDAFFGGATTRYDGPIPPGLAGYREGRVSPYRGPDVDKALALLAEAGFPNGRGLPPLRYHTNRGGSAADQAEMIARQLMRGGITMRIELHGFAELELLIKRKQAQMFALSWGSDYPDAENNLSLFFGPNGEGGVNGFNYSNPEFDELYRRATTLMPSPERTALYEHLSDIIIEDCPAIASLARTRYYALNRRVRELIPDETWYGWIKYVDLDLGAQDDVGGRP